MKKILTYAAPLAMALSFSTALPTAASAEANPIPGFCKQAVDNGGFDSVGGCMSLINTKGAVQACKFLDDFIGLEVLGFKNHGQCVKALNNN